MGNNLLKEKEYNIAIEGLSGSGKTSILQKLELGEVVPHEAEHKYPFYDVLQETVTFNYFKLSSLSTGGRIGDRENHRQYYESSSAVIFVIDSTDNNWLGDARFLVHVTLWDEHLKDAVVLILANKQDLSGAMGAKEMEKQLSMKKLKHKRCKLFGTSAVTGKGLNEAMNWLEQALKEKEDGLDPQPKSSLLSKPKSCLKKVMSSFQRVFVS